jgi:uncharacterized protein YwqG
MDATGDSHMNDRLDSSNTISAIATDHLNKRIVELGLQNIKDQIFRLIQPSICISTDPVDDDAMAAGASKFGGHPDLPPETHWPRCSRGPLGFAGQIALKDISGTQAARMLPKEGLLSIFIYQDGETGYQPGIVDGVTDDTQILYTPPNQTLVRVPVPDDINNETGIAEACRLTFSESCDLPDPEDHISALNAAEIAEFRDQQHYENLFQLREDLRSFGHHILGYSVHLQTSDPAPGPDWLHLLCLSSDSNLYWSWSDGGHLSVFVHKKDLTNGTFSRVFGYAS